ncbi:MAG TPA: BadF/BadG/BcrA/BcrD ATPase family protein [Cellulomonas sp.]
MSAARTPVTSVGIDIGGTKTRIVATGDGPTIDLTFASASWRGSATFPDAQNVVRLARLVHEHLAVDGSTRMAVGLHGGDTAEILDTTRRVLTAELGAEVLVVNDAELLGPAAGERHCIRMIAGTGAVVLGTRADGSVLSADGYSWLLGDFGSGAGLVRESLRAVLEGYDAGTLGGDPLLRLLLQAFEAHDPAHLSVRATQHAGADAWGAHAPQVFTAWHQGSATADRVIEAAAARLATGVAGVLGRGAVATSIVAAGGVVVHQPAFVERVRSALAVREVDLPLVVLTAAPVVGALRLAGDARTVIAGTVPEPALPAV